MYDDIIQELIAMIQGWTDMPVRRGALPAANAICLEKGSSDVIDIHLNRSTAEEISCVLNAKNADMKKALTTLEIIHQRLTRYPTYPTTDNWQMFSVETISGPAVIGREAGDQWLIGSSIRVKIYNKRGAF